MPEPVNLTFAFTLTPAAALDYFRAKGFSINPDGWAAVEAATHAKAFTVARVAALDVLQDIKTAVDKALSDGTTFAEFQQRLMPLLKTKGWWGKDPETGAQLGSPHRLSTIFRTNLQTSYMEGRWRGIMENVDDRPWFQYVAILDSRTRPMHRLLNGKVFRYDDPFWRRIRPPISWNCFLPDTEITGCVEYGLKSFYSGKAIKITTRSGMSLSVTPNHPIYTSRGWVSADKITKSDHLIRNTDRIDGVTHSLSLVNNQQSPTIAEQLFESMTTNGLRIVDVSPFKLNGNLNRGNAKVYVAAMNSHLMDGWDASLVQFIKDWILINAGNRSAVSQKETSSATVTDSGAVDVVDFEDSLDVGLGVTQGARNPGAGQVGMFVEIANHCFQSIISSRGSSPGFTALSNNSIPVRFHCGPFNGFRFGSGSDSDSVLSKNTIENVPTASRLFSQLIKACPGLIARDEVIEIVEFDFSGHVYDFQTETGIIFANGLMVHNCRCRFRALSDADLQRKGITPESGAGRISQQDVMAQGYPQPQASYHDPVSGQEVRTDVGWGYDRNTGWTPDPERYDPALRELLVVAMATAITIEADGQSRNEP